MNTYTKSGPLLAAMLALALTACETNSHSQQAEVLGGVIGGLAGTQIGEGRGRTAAIIVGAIAGSMIGRHIGETMDDADRSKTANALTYNTSGQSSTWVNPDNGYSYAVTPTRTYETEAGPCREFTMDATVGTKDQQEVYGTACLQSDGSWKLVK